MWPKKTANEKKAEAEILTAMMPGHKIYAPSRPGPLVLASPHSGRIYPKQFTRPNNIHITDLRSGEDAYLDYMLDAERGGPAGFIHALFPRCFVDVNRGPNEMNPADIEGPKAGFENSSRAKSGLGVIPMRVGRFESLYTAPLNRQTVKERIEGLYTPYHTALSGLITSAMRANGCALLLDLHSMPDASPQEKQADIVLGDMHGTSCRSETMNALEAIFRDLGYKTARNTPYAGGYTVQHYGKPLRGQEAIQIEINKALYWNAQTLSLTDGFEVLRAHMKTALWKMQIYMDTRPGHERIDIAAQ